MDVFVKRARIEVPAGDVFRWHANPGALERLTPPWDRVEVVERQGGIEDGARVTLRMRVGPLARRWIAEHQGYEEGRQFRDVQVEGPFARWEHTHRFEPAGPTACHLEDRIEYKLPLGPLGRLLGAALVRSRLEGLFSYRHRVTGQDVTAHFRGGGSPMRILVTGSSGLVGSVLVPFLTAGGHSVARLVRSKRGAGEGQVFWDPDEGSIDTAALEGLDAAVHLAGESISAGRWTAATKARIRESRVKGTRLLAETLARLNRPPKVLVSASAVGYYGSRSEDPLSEESSPGSGFLAEVCREWEAAAAPAAEAGIRVVRLRFGVILSPAGGALQRLLLPFRLGVGGRVGSGRQFMSWVALDDAVGAIHHALVREELKGPVNVVSPNPVRNSEFTRILGRVLRRPTVLPLPAFAMRLAFGKMADELLLTSQRIEPARLLSTGYQFRFPELEGALRHLLGRDAGASGRSNEAS